MQHDEVHQLREREKELRCLYRVHEIVTERGQSPMRAFVRVLEAIPAGWQRPEASGARIEYMGRSYVGPGYNSDGALLREAIRVHGVEVGSIEVSDSAGGAPDGGVFLDDERVLLVNIAHRLGDYLEWKHTEMLGAAPSAAALHWRWREQYAEALAGAMDFARFGVERVAIGGSTQRGEAGPGSDIDLIVVQTGSGAQREALAMWIEGWSLCLGEVAHQQTGYSFAKGIINVEWEEDADALRGRADVRVLRGG